MASEVKTNKVSPASGTTVTLGNSGDTISVASGATASGFLPSSISTSGDDFQFNSGYGSVATAYGCRAWVNFNSESTLTILESGNVSSITDNGTGDFTINFSTAMSDANYAFSGSGMPIAAHGANHPRVISAYRGTQTASNIRILHSGAQSTTDFVDGQRIYFAAFR